MFVRETDLEKLLHDIEEIHKNVLYLPHEEHQNMAALAIGGHLSLIRDRIENLLGIEKKRKQK